MSKSAGKPMSGGVFELRGKTKDLRAGTRPGVLIQQFKEEGLPDQSAAPGEELPLAKLANDVSSYLFSYLHGYNIPTHFVEKDGGSRMMVRQLKMYPLVIRVWNTAVGPLARRLGMKEGTDLSFPVLEHYYKPGGPTPQLVNDFHLFSLGIVSPEELRTINRLASKSNAVLRSLFSRRGLKLFSAMFEFGVADGQIMLGDELTPRTCLVGEGQGRPRRTREAARGNGHPAAGTYRLMHDRLLGGSSGMQV